MNHFWIFFTISLVNINHVVFGCWLPPGKSFISCTSLESYETESNSSWTSLWLSSGNKVYIDLKPNAFRTTPNLEKLKLHNIKSIQSGAFDGLTKVTALIIFTSSFKEIPLNLIDNLPIDRMRVISTQITRIIPGFFDNLHVLTFVEFGQNNIKTITTGIFNNTGIEDLYLYNNGIETIEDNAFINMNKLNTLDFALNNLREFNSTRILGTSKLTDLWLYENKLTTITRDAFSGVPNLRRLFLETNEINHIEYGAFNSVPLLEVVDLSQNQLTEIHPQIFPNAGMQNLRVIFFQSNKLTFINNVVFIKLPKLTSITYGGNPFQCPCLDEIINWVASQNISRVCDTDYTSGNRPACIVSPKCDIRQGYENSY